MRKLLPIALIFIALFFGYSLFKSVSSFTKAGNSAVAPEVVSETKVSEDHPVISKPKTLSIPSLNIDASVEFVGLTSKGAMDIPKKDQDVAWYQLGVKPGEIGNAVIAGHLDKKDGSPAVFYDIKNLKKGDKINVEDESGKVRSFVVTRTATYEMEKFPLEEVFGNSTRANLNLITCEGVFNTTSRLYSHRFVVYSELAE